MFTIVFFFSLFFFFNDTATTEIYTLSLHDALPILFVIPTELVHDNGPRLATMVGGLADGLERGPEFREWLGRRVRFCSSLVDRITTGTPARDVRAALEQRLGYADALPTLAQPQALWAIEADPAELRATFGIDVLPESVIIAPDIGFYRE